MPYVYIGRRNFYIGKTLWEILGNLRDFGVGRMLVRSKFERYPEVTFYRILRTEPLMDEKNLFGRVWVDQVFRGRQYEGEIELTKVTYKNDFKLIPKDEEEAYLKRVLAPEELKKSVLPEYIEFPPLLREMIKNKQNVREPLLKAVYAGSIFNHYEVEPGSVSKKKVMDDSKAPHLYANILSSLN